MRQIITLEKEIAFKTMVGEITSISLEPELDFINDSEIEGNLLITGTYKMTEASTIEENFNYKIPVNIMLTTSLDEEKRKIDINNFTYQIVNEEALEIKVEVLIEGLEKIEIDDITTESALENLEVREKIEEPKEEIEVLKTEEVENTLHNLEEVKEKKEAVNEIFTEKDEIMENNNIKEDNSKEAISSIFSAFANTAETYATYSIYILREDDNLEEIISKYKTTREALKEYNDLENLKIGTKLIIPTSINEASE